MAMATIDSTNPLEASKYILTAVLVLGLGILLVDYGRLLHKRSKMPPGPLPLPIVGNVLQLPKEKPWYRFEEWSKKFDNPVITVWIGRNPIVVLNDAWTASDLMDKRANIYSSRPVFQVPGRLMGGGDWDQPLLPYGDKWRRHRKLMVFHSLTSLTWKAHRSRRSGGSRSPPLPGGRVSTFIA
jgi:hypothetical protein